MPGRQNPGNRIAPKPSNPWFGCFIVSMETISGPMYTMTTNNKKIYHGLDFCDVLIYPNASAFLEKSITSRRQISVEKTFMFNNCVREWVPIMASNMDTVGTFETAKILSEFMMPTFLHKFLSAERINDFLRDTPDVRIENLFFTTGISDSDLDRCVELAKILYEARGYHKSSINICIDAANAKSEYFIDRAKVISTLFPDCLLCVGNVASGEAALRLYESLGAEIIKIGLGSGACCRTRTKTGIGVPQFSAIQWTAEYLQKTNSKRIQKKPYIISDGGITNPGDIVKAFAVGADMVMVGSYFAGHKENCVYDHNHKPIVRGMASREVFEDHYKEESKPNYKSWEGIEVNIPRVDTSLKEIVYDILGGIRSACTYQNVISLEDFCKIEHTFIECNRQINPTFQTR